MSVDLRPAGGLAARVAQARPAPPDGRARRAREARLAYAFLSPVLVFFLIFLVLPFVFALVLALSSWNGFDLGEISFVGMKNFAGLLSPDSDFIAPILVRTVIFAGGSVGLAVIAALVIANAINKLRFQGFFRLLYFLPIATTVVAVGNVWKSIYEPSGGLANGVLDALGMRSLDFLENPCTALPAIVVTQAWASLGIAVLILTAGLKAIPDELYEAAQLDGANSWVVFWKITLPMLRPALLFVTVTQAILGLQSFALILVMTGDGGPAGSTTVAALETYTRAFKFGAWGTASAMAFVLFLVIFAVTLLQLWLARKSEEESA